ncbi:MAG: O-antigen ligase family protein, partial [Coriobacteriia bacterium]|nr:O-antigen ligase family protein [Coriobacteriia bacterium]
MSSARNTPAEKVGATSRTGGASSTARATSARTLVLVGIFAATFGVAVVIAPGGLSPFGPIKAFVLCLACACVALGFALDPALPVAALSRVISSRGPWAAIVFIDVVALSIITSMDPTQSVLGHYPEYQGFALLFASALVALGAFALADEERTWRVLARAAVVTLLLVAGYGALQLLGLDPVATATEFVVRRVRSTVGNASNLGVLLVLALPFALERVRRDTGAWRVAAGVSLATGGVTLAYSLSRGAWVAALIGTLAWLLVEGRRQDRATRTRFAALAIAGVLAAAVATALLVPYAASRAATLADPSSGTAGWRTAVWSRTAQMIVERPLLGFGPATFRYAFPPRRTAAMQAGESGFQIIDDPHNLLLSAGVSSGVLALLALAWLLAEALLAAWRPRGDGAPDDSLQGPALASAIAAGATALQFHFVTIDTASLLAVFRAR